jgi:hypothetical protein
MKKLSNIIACLTLVIPFSIIQPLNAALFTDINGAYIDLGDEGSVTGAGISLLWDMPRYFDNEKVLFYINSTFAYSINDKDKPKETVRTYVPLSAGFEYRHQMFQLPLYITGSAGAGVSYFEKQGPAHYGPYIDPSQTRIDSAFGPYTELMLGVNYVLSQNTAVFARGGYQMSLYDDDKVESPAGFQFTLGFRITISGSLKSYE